MGYEDLQTAQGLPLLATSRRCLQEVVLHSREAVFPLGLPCGLWRQPQAIQEGTVRAAVYDLQQAKI